MADLTTLKINPRKPQDRVVEKARKEGNPIPIAQAPFEIQIPSYGVEDILSAVENNNQKVLQYIARLINAEVVSTVRSQLSDDEQFPVDQEIDTENFDLDALKLQAMAEVESKSTALQLEFDDEQFQQFSMDFIKVLLPVFDSIRDAEVKLMNTANALVNGYKAIRNEPEKMERVKTTLDRFMSEAPDEIAANYIDMYDWFGAMKEKRMNAWKKKQEKTDVFLD